MTDTPGTEIRSESKAEVTENQVQTPNQSTEKNITQKNELRQVTLESSFDTSSIIRKCITESQIKKKTKAKVLIKQGLKSTNILTETTPSKNNKRPLSVSPTERATLAKKSNIAL